MLQQQQAYIDVCRQYLGLWHHMKQRSRRGEDSSQGPLHVGQISQLRQTPGWQTRGQAHQSGSRPTSARS